MDSDDNDIFVKKKKVPAKSTAPVSDRPSSTQGAQLPQRQTQLPRRNKKKIFTESSSDKDEAQTPCLTYVCLTSVTSHDFGPQNSRRLSQVTPKTCPHI